MEEKAREGIIRRMRKDMVVFVHFVVGKKKFLVQFKDRQKIDVDCCLLTSICFEKEVGREVNRPSYDLPPKEG